MSSLSFYLFIYFLFLSSWGSHTLLGHHLGYLGPHLSLKWWSPFMFQKTRSHMPKTISHSRDCYNAFRTYFPIQNSHPNSFGKTNADNVERFSKTFTMFIL